MAVRVGRGRTAGVAAIVLGLLATAAGTSHASDIGIHFSTQKPSTGAAMTLHIRYTKAGDPNAKPSPIRKLRIDAPAGTAFHTSAIPACKASDAEVQLLGASACPASSKLGDGPIVVITGFGPPFDPFTSPTPVFNDGNGWLEISQTPSTPAATIAITRETVTGSRISGDIAAAPGGPPDFQSAVSTVDLSFPASTGYITTPPTCPASGRWVTIGTFTFADGTTETARGETPCGSIPPRAPKAPARIRMRLRPNTVRAGERARIRIRLMSRELRCVAHTLVRRHGHRPVRTDRAGRATITGAFHGRGRRTLIASRRGCASGRATLTVLPET